MIVVFIVLVALIVYCTQQLQYSSVAYRYQVPQYHSRYSKIVCCNVVEHLLQSVPCGALRLVSFLHARTCEPAIEKALMLRGGGPLWCCQGLAVTVIVEVDGSGHR